MFLSLSSAAGDPAAASGVNHSPAPASEERLPAPRPLTPDIPGSGFLRIFPVLHNLVLKPQSLTHADPQKSGLQVIEILVTTKHRL